MGNNKELTLRQAKYVKGTEKNLRLKKPKTKKAVALAAGYSEGVAHNPHIIENSCKGLLRKALTKAGVTEGFLAKRIKKGCEATKTEIAKFEGEITDEKEYEDLPTSRGFLQLACELRGDLEVAKDTQPIINIQQNISNVQNFIGLKEAK